MSGAWRMIKAMIIIISVAHVRILFQGLRD